MSTAMPYIRSVSTHAEIAAALAELKTQGILDSDVILAALHARGITTVRGRTFTRAAFEYYRNIPQARSSAALRLSRQASARNLGTHTPADWQAVLGRAKGHCESCGKPTDQLEKDHIKPIHLGGSDLPTNLRALCRLCNMSRGNFLHPLAGMIRVLRLHFKEDVETFGQRFDRSGRTIEDWEQGRRTPDPYIKRNLLKMLHEEELFISASDAET